MTLLWILAGLMFVYSLAWTIGNNFTTGTLIIWGITLCLVLYCVFHKQINSFCAAGFGRVLKIVFFAGYTVFAGLFVFVAVSGYTNNAKGNEKAIIVLGAGLHGEEVSGLLARRLEAGLAAWQSNPDALLVVSGGQGPQEAIPEALAMQRWLLARGVPEESIIVEDKSTSTRENLEFSRTLLAQAGVGTEEPVAVVSNAFHCYRAGVYAGKAGFSQVSTVPASINPLSILPSYTREVLALLDLWLFHH